MSADLLNAALAYAAAGWPVFPCEPRGKKPLTPNGFKDATTDPATIRARWARCPDANLGLPTGERSGVLVLDLDRKNGHDGVAELQTLAKKHGTIPRTACARTAGGGLHLLFRHVPGIGNRTGILPGVDVRGEGGYIVAPPSVGANGTAYAWAVEPSEALVDCPAWGLDLIRGANGAERPRHEPLAPGELIPQGERNDRLFRLAASLRAKGLSEPAIRAALLEENRLRCDPPLPAGEVEKIAESAGRYPEGSSQTAGGLSSLTSQSGTPPGRQGLSSLTSLSSQPDTPRVWPTLPPEVLHGLFREVVRTLEPHTEADPAAILFQFLAAFGNVIGRSSHFRVEADEHPGNIFLALLGESAKGRKGTSWSHIKRLYRSTDEAWAFGRVVSGLSSGEGLKYNVRDPRTEKQPIKEKGKVIGYQEVETDAGVQDRRLLVVEPELASTLRVLQRDGNTLSAVVRCAWDDGNLRTLTKSDPTTATGAHISIIGHCTNHELLRYLDSTEAGNGFANRFLWACARRSKELPEGGELHKVDLRPLLRRLTAAVDFGARARELRRDEAARGLWREVYHDLSAAKPGLYGAVTARGEAQVVRLSLLYALGDCSPVIRQEHLLAALGAWAYCDASARYIFGTATGDRVADRIEEELRAKPQGLTRKELHDLFGRHEAADRIEKALSLLRTAKRIQVEAVSTGGRPSERWSVCRSCEKSEESEESPPCEKSEESPRRRVAP